MKYLQILKAEYVEDYKLAVAFSDGVTKTVDFGPFLKASKHPEIKKYLDLTLFKNFSVVKGDLDWNDFDLAFPIADLYNNCILKSQNQNNQAAS